MIDEEEETTHNSYTYSSASIKDMVVVFYNCLKN